MRIIGLLTLLTILVVTRSCNNNPKSLKCDNVVCDTISNYYLTQICKDTTILYDLTYIDTAKLIRPDGELTFSIHECGHCEGVQQVDMIGKNNKVVQTVKVNYNGNGKSENIRIESLNIFLDKIIKVNWIEHGKIFYITQ